MKCLSRSSFRADTTLHTMPHTVDRQSYSRESFLFYTCLVWYTTKRTMASYRRDVMVRVSQDASHKLKHTQRHAKMTSPLHIVKVLQNICPEYFPSLPLALPYGVPTLLLGTNPKHRSCLSLVGLSCTKCSRFVDCSASTYIAFHSFVDIADTSKYM